MKIYFIGAGPGDPELLTIKAKKIIRKADIIIYAGSLINPAILKFAPKSALSYDSSKMSLDEVIAIFQTVQRSETKDKLSLRDRGRSRPSPTLGRRSNPKIIARIHSGDPSIYGAIQEQISWCEKEKIPHEVIPGVSSFCAAAASLKQELTLPDISQTVIITRLAGRTKVPAKEDLRVLAKIKATLVIFLSIDKIEEVVKQLLCGYKSDTPVAIVSRASWQDEKKITGTLKDITWKVKQEKITKQALIFVGDVLKRKDFELSKLYDKNFTHGFRDAKHE